MVTLICIVNQVLGSLHWGADFLARAVDSPPVVSTLLMTLVGANLTATPQRPATVPVPRRGDVAGPRGPAFDAGSQRRLSGSTAA